MIKQEKGRYVTIHGPDGVGKTTAGRAVARMLQENGGKAVFFDDWRTERAWSNPFSHKDLRDQIASDTRQFTILQLAKVAFDSMQITRLTDDGITVVKDRGIYDVRADLQYRGLKPDECAGPLVREPDLAVLLTANEERRQARLATKVDLSAGDLAPFEPGSRLYQMNESLRQQVSSVSPERGAIIDTSPLSAEEVAYAIYQVISSL